MALTEQHIQALLNKLGALRNEIGKVIIGQQEVIDEILICLLAGGHGLLEGVPGLAKTLMVRTLSQALELSFRRIQFTPDLMPSDIVGTEVLQEDPATGKRFFNFTKGPLFAQVVLADEINRTPPKTQAALLEAMQEGAVTYSGKTYPLDKPFLILATQNPIEQSGTYPLPEAQADRFLLLIRVAYPSEQEEIAMLKSTTGKEKAQIQAVMGAQDIQTLQQLTRQLPVSDDLVQYAAQLVRMTRPDHSSSGYVKEWVRWGAGPRAGQALLLTAKARALLSGRYAVTLADLQQMALPVLRHRVLVNFRAEAQKIDADTVIKTLLHEVVPVASLVR